MAVVKRPNSKYWRIVLYRDGRQMAYSSKTEDELEARRMELEILSAVRHKAEEGRLALFLSKVSGETVKRPGLPLSHAWSTYLRQPGQAGKKERTLSGKRAIWDRFVLWLKAHYPTLDTVGDVTRDIAVAYMRQLEGSGVSGQTYNNNRNALNSVCKALMHPAGLAENPFSVTMPLPATHASWRPFARAEVKKILEATTGEWRLAVMIGLYTGLRWKDVAHLDWGNVDLEAGVISLMPAKTERFNKSIQIPIHPELAKALTAGGQGRIMPGLAASYAVKDQQVFFSGLLRGLEITGKVGFHSLRHTFVTLLQEAGAGREVARDLAGHGNVEITRLYSHALEPLRRAVEGINL